MSFNMEIFLVDINLVNTKIGSKDDAIYQNIITQYSDDIEQLDEWFEDEIEEGMPPLADTVKELIDGKCSAPKFDFQYIIAMVTKFSWIVLFNLKLDATLYLI